MKRLIKIVLIVLLIVFILFVACGCFSSPRKPVPYDYSAQEAKKETLVAQGEYLHLFGQYGYILLNIKVYASQPSDTEAAIYTVEVKSQFIPGIVSKQNGDSSFGSYYNKRGYVCLSVITDGETELVKTDYYPRCSIDGILSGAQPSSSNIDEIQWGYDFPTKVDQPYTVTSNYCFCSDGIDAVNLKVDCAFFVKRLFTKENRCSFNFIVDANKCEITAID